MIVVLGAVRNEVHGLERAIGVQNAGSEPGWRWSKGIWGKRDILVAETGMGRLRAEAATQAILKSFPVSAVISCGFGGALASGLDVGDIVLCAELYGGSEPSGQVYASSPDLIALGTSHADALVGNSFTSDTLVSEPEEKKALGQAFGAHVVDMESYWIARLLPPGIPFLAVRVISDLIDERLPPLHRFVGADGTIQGPSLALYLASHPGQLVRLLPFYMHARQAAERLTQFMSLLIPVLAREVKGSQ